MQIEGFNSILQDSLSSMEKHFRSLTDSFSVMGVVQEISEYSARVKKEITEQYYRLNSELQYQYVAVFDEFVNKCNKLIDESMEALKNNEVIVALANDIFYNDESLHPSR
jgi:hypothetical protein